jgi:hypothetical protein
VTQRFDTEAMAMALFEHDASGLGCLGHPGWDWESQADDVRATRLADAGQLIQRYITRAEERAPTEPTTAPLAAASEPFTVGHAVAFFYAARDAHRARYPGVPEYEADGQGAMVLAEEAAARARAEVLARLEATLTGGLTPEAVRAVLLAALRPSPLASAFGQWPGDESDAELAAALRGEVGR